MDGEIAIYDTQSGRVAGASYQKYSVEEIRRFRARKHGDYKVASLTVLSNPDRVLVGGWDGQINILNVTPDHTLAYAGAAAAGTETIASDSLPTGQAGMCDAGGALYYTGSGFLNRNEDVRHSGVRSRCRFLHFAGPNQSFLVGWDNSALHWVSPTGEWHDQPINLTTNRPATDADASRTGDWIATVDRGGKDGGSVTFYRKNSQGSFEFAFSENGSDRLGRSHVMQTRHGENACCALTAIRIVPGSENRGAAQLLTAANDGKVVLWNVTLSAAAN